MKSLRLILTLMAVAYLVALSGCGHSKINKLEMENADLKNGLEKAQQQIKELEAKQNQEDAARAQEEARRKQEILDRDQAETKRKQVQEEQKAQAILKCFEQIALRMESLNNEPKDMTLKSLTELEAMETRLLALANAKKEEMGESVIELRGLDIDTSEIQHQIDTFINNYGWMISYSRLGYSAISNGGSKEDIDRYFATERKDRDLAHQAYLATMDMAIEAKKKTTH